MESSKTRNKKKVINGNINSERLLDVLAVISFTTYAALIIYTNTIIGIFNVFLNLLFFVSFIRIGRKVWDWMANKKS